MRFGFVTCVQLGLSCMKEIYEIGGKLDLAITLPDDRATGKSGRVYLDDFCAHHRIPLLKSGNVNDDRVIEAIEAARLDWLFIIGWSQIARERVLNAPRLGVLGMHPTLLPQGRGRAAIPWAILKRLERTGVTLFKLDGGVDTGPVLEQIEIPLGPSADATGLYADLDAAHVSLMRSAYPRLIADTIRLRPQDEAAATLWPARKPEDGELRSDMKVADAECLVRAVTRPYPGAFMVRDGRRIIVWRARVVDPDGSCGADPCLTFSDGVLQAVEWEEAAPVG